MTMRPAAGEPVAGPWRTATMQQLSAQVLAQRQNAEPRPVVVSVDGRSGAGKTTFAERLLRALPSAALVRTDDLAWHAPMFGWQQQLIDGVLLPCRSGEPVRFRPSAWVERGRPGAVEVPGDVSVLVIEGVGSGCRDLADYLDVLIWVQSDFAEAQRRGLARDIASGGNGDVAASTAFWHTWMADELPFFAQDRPWERATVIVAGVPTRSGDARISIAPPFRCQSGSG